MNGTAFSFPNKYFVPLCEHTALGVSHCSFKLHKHNSLKLNPLPVHRPESSITNSLDDLFSGEGGRVTLFGQNSADIGTLKWASIEIQRQCTSILRHCQVHYNVMQNKLEETASSH